MASQQSVAKHGGVRTSQHCDLRCEGGSEGQRCAGVLQGGGRRLREASPLLLRARNPEQPNVEPALLLRGLDQQTAQKGKLGQGAEPEARPGEAKLNENGPSDIEDTDIDIDIDSIAIDLILTISLVTNPRNDISLGMISLMRMI